MSREVEGFKVTSMEADMEHVTPFDRFGLSESNFPESHGSETPDFVEDAKLYHTLDCSIKTNSPGSAPGASNVSPPSDVREGSPEGVDSAPAFPETLEVQRHGPSASQDTHQEYSTNEKTPLTEVSSCRKLTAVDKPDYTKLPPLSPLHIPIKLDRRAWFNPNQYKTPKEGM